jgi:membrane protease YdiL (CAAX protease family)
MGLTPTTLDAAVPPSRPETKRIAPDWHTIVLVLLLIATSALGAHMSQKAAASAHHVAVFVQTLVWEWLLFAYVWWGLRRRHTALREVIGGRWASPEDFLLDLAIALGFLFFAWIVLGVISIALAAWPCFVDRLHKGMPVGSGPAIMEMIRCGAERNLPETKRLSEFIAPTTRLEMWLAIAVSCTAGFVEEVIYRGYLQRQFGSWTRSIVVGLIASALLFGLSHGYEGPSRMVVIAIYGAMFGIVAVWRKSLRPGMMTHALFDSAQLMILYFAATHGGIKMPA